METRRKQSCTTIGTEQQQIPRRSTRISERIGETMKRYNYRVTDQNGMIIFFHRSNYAYRLINAADKASRSSDGAIYASWYFGHTETNIPDDVAWAVYEGRKI